MAHGTLVEVELGPQHADAASKGRISQLDKKKKKKKKEEEEEEEEESRPRYCRVKSLLGPSRGLLYACQVRDSGMHKVTDMRKAVVALRAAAESAVPEYLKELVAPGCHGVVDSLVGEGQREGNTKALWNLLHRAQNP